MLEDLLLKARLNAKGVGGGTASSRSVFSSPAGTRVGDNVPSHSVYSLSTITESTKSEQAVVGSHGPCSTRQADEALYSVPVV